VTVPVSIRTLITMQTIYRSKILPTDNITLYDRNITEGGVSFAKNAYLLLFIFFDIFGIDDNHTPCTDELVYLYEGLCLVKKKNTLKALQWLKENDYINSIVNEEHHKNPYWELTKNGRRQTITKKNLGEKGLQDLVDNWNSGEQIKGKWFISIPLIKKAPSTIAGSN